MRNRLRKIILHIHIILLILMVVSCSFLGKDTGKFKVVDGKELFFSGNNQIVDRLVTYEGDEYFIKEDGTKAKNEWVQVDNDGSWWAYFGARGKMIKNALWIINSQLFIFDENGKLKKDGLVEFNDELYYATKEGYLLKEQLKTIDGKAYYFDNDGKQVKIATTSWVENKNINGLSDLPTGWYLIQPNGELVKSQWYDGYYLEDNGVMAIDKWIGEGEDRIYVGENGKKSTDYKEIKNLLTDILNSNKGSTNTNYNTNNSYSIWELKYYVNEFKEFTNEKYLKAIFSGEFDNVVTAGSKCDFLFLVDDYVYVKLYEYGWYEVKSYSGTLDKYYNISLRMNNGNHVSFTGYLSDDRIRVDNYGSSYIINSLKASEPFKLIIEEDTSSNQYLTPSKYLVEVVPSNFNSLYWR